MGLSGDAVREASHDVKRVPAVVRLHELDQGYRRSLLDPKRAIIPPLLLSAFIKQLLGGDDKQP